MGSLLTYPPKAEADRLDKLLAKGSNNYNSRLGPGHKRFPLPYNRFSMNTRTPEEETEVKRQLNAFKGSPDNTRIEIEPLKLNSHNESLSSSFDTSIRSTRYIKRYRTEEEKLLDIIQERDATIRSAIRQGQELRAKCNRYKEELDSLKAMSDIDMTHLEWKKKYNKLDKRYRDLKEELDILTARNKNGRDQLQHQSDIIEDLNNQLQHERIDKQSLLSNSLSSLHSVGVKDKKGKLMIAQLQVDKRLLQERLNELTVRNQRGRQYLSQLEEEKREQEEIISSLKEQLMNERSEKENLKDKVSMLETKLTFTNRDIQQNEESPALYAQVKKTEIHPGQSRREVNKATHLNSYEDVFSQTETAETKSTGLNTTDAVQRRYQTRSEVYEEVRFVEDVPKENEDSEVNNHDRVEETERYYKDEEPYLTTYNYQRGSSGVVSTPKVTDDIVVTDTEPVWEHNSMAEEMSLHNDVTTKF